MENTSSKQSFVKEFYSGRSSFDSHTDPLLDIRAAHRWFEWLKYGADNDVYNFQEVMQGKSGPDVLIRDETIRMMSSYDYLGLIGHAEIEAAAIDAIKEFGTGTGGVRLLTGTNELHCKLEEKISSFKGTEASMVLSSGYMANLAAIAALFGENDLIITDESVHRSIVDAVIVSGSHREKFRHNDADSLKEILEKYQGIKRKLIIAEGVYSMDGDICPLDKLVELKRKHGAFLLVDEAHSLGVIGETGRGADEHFNMDPGDIDIFTGSLSKSIPSNGGFVCAREEVIAYLKHGGAPYMFSAALTPANTAASLKSFDIIREESWRLQKLRANIRQMKQGLQQAGINTGHSESAVIPVLCGDYRKAVKLSAQLFKKKFLANSVIYPAVPHNKARLRLCCTAAQSTGLIDEFLQAIAELHRVL